MIVIGTDQGETLDGTAAADEIFGRRGDDAVNALGGNDLVYWSTGAQASASDGGDFTDGGDGIDRFLVISGYTVLHEAQFTYSHSYRLEAGGAGLATWSMTSGKLGFPDFQLTETTVVTGMRRIESFSFSGVHGPATASGGASGSAETIFVADLRATELTGLLLFDLGAGVDALDAGGAYNQIVALGGDGDDTLIGGMADDELQGGAGDDRLRGNGGTNTLIGGAGSDIYFSENRFDSVLELAGEGMDALSTRAALYGLQANVENLVYSGIGDFTGMGNALDNVVEGGNGNDYLIGYAGNDSLYGRGGVNTLQGGMGNDNYYATSQSDTVYELAGEGIDSVATLALAYTLPANVENLRELSPLAGVNWTGNALDNVIVGTAVRDELWGLEGNDILDAGLGGNNGGNVLRGGQGDDIYRLGSDTDQVIELAGEGNDTVELRVGTWYVLGTNVENLVAVTSSDVKLDGNTLDNRLTGNGGQDILSGNTGNDTLSGGTNIDWLQGDAGNDVLNGGLGADYMAGGSGADIFVFDNAADQDRVDGFRRSEGDKVNVAPLLASVGYAGGSNAFADGYLRIVAVPAEAPSFQPMTRLQFDPDGSAGPSGFLDVAIFGGGTAVIAPQDLICS